MKISFIVEPRKTIGGGVRAAMNLSKGLKKYNKVDSVIFGAAKGTVSDDEIEFSYINMMNPISLKYYKELKKFLNNYKPEVIHCLGLYSALLCIIYKSFNKSSVRIVCTVHRVTMNMRYLNISKGIIKRISKSLDHTTFLTGLQKKHYFENIGFKPKKNTIVPNVIFVESYSEQEIDVLYNELKNELGADVLLSYIGRIIPSKNIEDFIRIISMLNNKGLNAGGVIVGGYDKEHYDSLQELISSLNISSKVTFKGYVNTPTLYISSTDYILFPTKTEALPNLLIESFALGKIVFSSDIPQMTDLIDNEINGYTTSLSNLDEYCEKIIKVNSLPSLRKEIEENAKITYNKIYSPEVTTNKYYKVYLDEEC